MSRQRNISASNAVVNAVEGAAAIYGVRSYRMQSRAFYVPGEGGRTRPMFMGAWKDRFGTIHRKGMADILLTPHVKVAFTSPDGENFTAVYRTIPLWVECKFGTGKLEREQILFRDDVVEAGAHYIEAHDSADAVVAWFEANGVKR
jgi:hypothetical protein